MLASVLRIMQVLAVIVGFLVLAGTTLDLLWTTLWSDGGGGPLTTRLAGLQWRAVRRLSGGERRGRLLSIAGPVIMVSVLLTWVLLLFLGWD